MKVLFTIILWILFSTVFAGDKEIGNGGDVVVCKNNDGSIKSVELLDYYEARTMRGIVYDLGPEDLGIYEKIQIALNRLERFDPRRAQKYQEFVDEFENNARRPKGITLTGIDDSFHIAFPSGCRVEQIINQNKPVYPQDKRYTINQDLWDILVNNKQNDDLAGLILHEVIYRDALSMEHEDSRHTRYFNSIISSKEIENYTEDHLAYFYKIINFDSLFIKGVYAKPREMTFYDNGKIDSIYLVDFEEHQFLYQGKYRKISRYLSFYSNGNIKHIHFIRNEKIELKLGNHIFSANISDDLVFYEEGSVKIMYLMEDTIIPFIFENNISNVAVGGRNYVHFNQNHSFRGEIHFKDNISLDYGKFKLRLCEKYSPASYATFKTTFNDLGLLMDTEFRWQEVAENSIVTIYGIEVNLKKESSILFHENGNIKHATFQDPVEVIFPDGSRYKIKANTPSSFYEDGAVKEAVFTDPLQIVFPNGSENTIIPNTKVVFHKNFKLKEARLSHPLTISDTNGLKNIIQSGVNIVFDNNLIVEQIYSLSNIKSIKIKTYLGTFSASLANPKCIYGPTPNHYYTCYITGISFYSNGNVKTLKTSEDKKRVNILGIPMLTNGLFQFYENGIIKNIKLLEAIEVMDYHGNIRKCEEYSEPFFNDDGTLNNCY